MPTSRLEILKAFASTYFGVGMVAIIFVAIMIRDSGLYPHVFADEYSYSKFSRLLPLASSEISNYLYLGIYRVTNICGDGFLGCVRILNALFFLFSAPFIYFTARRVTSKTIATLIMVVALVGPINTYTAYFMPESIYFLAFWIFTWWILGVEDFRINRSWLLVGMLIGVCSLIKPHGIFLLIPVSFYILGIKLENLATWKDFFGIVGTTILAAIGLKLLLGYLLAGRSGLTIFGSTYELTIADFFKSIFQGSTEASSTLKLNQRIIVPEAIKEISIARESTNSNGLMKLFSLVAYNFYGQLLAIILLYGFPLIVGLTNLLKHNCNSKKLSSTVARRYSLFGLSNLFLLMLVAAVFSGFLAFSYGGEVLRLQARYYNFTFPLLIMLVVSGLQYKPQDLPTKIQKVVALVIIFFIIYGLACYIKPYQPTVIDSPELFGLYQVKWIFYIFGVLFIAISLYWLRNPDHAIHIYIYSIVPIFIITITCLANQNLLSRKVADQYDDAGITAKRILSKEEISDLVVVGDNPIELSRILFYLDNPKSSIQKIDKYSIYDIQQHMHAGDSLALIMNGHLISGQIENRRDFGQFTIVGGHGARKINLELSQWKPSEISYVEGLYLPPEQWGTWSTGKVVKFIFARSLPQKYKVKLQARAFGRNAQQNFVFKSTSFQKTFSLSSDFSEIVINVDGSEVSNWIEIDIPHPQSPKELGLGDDERMLGIGIKSILIMW